jgi:hypothetical protein
MLGDHAYRAERQWVNERNLRRDFTNPQPVLAPNEPDIDNWILERRNYKTPITDVLCNQAKPIFIMEKFSDGEYADAQKLVEMGKKLSESTPLFSRQKEKVLRNIYEAACLDNKLLAMRDRNIAIGMAEAEEMIRDLYHPLFKDKGKIFCVMEVNRSHAPENYVTPEVRKSLLVLELSTASLTPLDLLQDTLRKNIAAGASYERCHSLIHQYVECYLQDKKKVS